MIVRYITQSILVLFVLLVSVSANAQITEIIETPVELLETGLGRYSCKVTRGSFGTFASADVSNLSNSSLLIIKGIPSQSNTAYNSTTQIIERNIGSHDLDIGDTETLTYRATTKECGEFPNITEIKSTKSPDIDSTPLVMASNLWTRKF